MTAPMPSAELKLSDFSGMRGKDVVGLWYGYKKIISVGLEEGPAKKLEKVFGKYGFCFGAADARYDYRKTNRTYIISKKPAYIRAAVAAYNDNRYDVVGSLLGYPACCVRKHYALIHKKGPMNDFIRRSAAGSARFLWELNNILDFDGRLCGKKAEGLDLSRVPHSSLISHNPCSYDCAPSLKIAKLNGALLRRHLALQGAESDPALLARPVLYADDFNFAVLDGASAPGRAAYGGVLFSLGLEDIRKELAACDLAVVSGRSLALSRGGKPVLKKDFPEKPLILPFDR